MKIFFSLLIFYFYFNLSALYAMIGFVDDSEEYKLALKSGTTNSCHFKNDVPRSMIGDWGWEIFWGRCNRGEPDGLNQCLDIQKENVIFEWNCSNKQIQGVGIEYYSSKMKRREYTFDQGRLKRLIHYNQQGIKIAEYDFENNERTKSWNIMIREH